MKKIMFSDKFCLTLAVLYRTKTMTRRLLRDNVPLGNWEETVKHLPYKIGEVIAIAQSYNDIGKPQYDKFGKGVAGNSNKMFVRANLMPHHIRITEGELPFIKESIEKNRQFKTNGYSIDESIVGVKVIGNIHDNIDLIK